MNQSKTQLETSAGTFGSIEKIESQPTVVQKINLFMIRSPLIPWYFSKNIWNDDGSEFSWSYLIDRENWGAELIIHTLFSPLTLALYILFSPMMIGDFIITSIVDASRRKKSKAAKVFNFLFGTNKI